MTKAKVLPTASTREALLRRRIAAFKDSVKWATEQAAACRRSNCIRSAEYWDRAASDAKASIMMAQHELKGMSK